MTRMAIMRGAAIRGFDAVFRGGRYRIALGLGIRGSDAQSDLGTGTHFAVTSA